MLKIAPHLPQPLYSVEATRNLERAVQAELPDYTLMQRAGKAAEGATYRS